MAVSGQNIFWFFDTGVDRWKFHTLSPSLSLSYLRLERQIARIIVENVFWIFLLLPTLPLNVHNLFFNLRVNNEKFGLSLLSNKFADFLNNCLGFNPKNAIFFFEFIIFAKSVVTAILLQQKTSSSSFAIAASINSEKLKNSPSHLSSSMCLFLLAECSVCSDVFALRTWALGDQLDLHPVQPAPSCGHFPLDVLIDTSIFFLKFLNNFTDATKCIDNEHQPCRAVYAKIRV